jgi:surface polysaccharide O-acyltransferase-like enzyme
MSETTSLTASHARPRLKFIDMARSFAILLMLEGHFTGAALADQYRSSEYWLYNVWHNLHGLTSPLFFTVTGLIFVYLLSANNEINY